MTPAQARIARAIYASGGAMTAVEIAGAISWSHDDVIRDLHALQDSGDVLMRNGLYRVSELYKSRCGVGA